MYSEKEILHYRQEKDDAFRRSHTSPIPAHERAGFRGLHYYPPSPGHVVPARLVPAEKPRSISIATSDGQRRTYEVVGHFEFNLDGHAGRLTAFRQDEADPHLFVPFRDTTAPKETYGAGRYLDLDRSPSGVTMLDFNFAYNPFCAYSDEFSCPFPPPENWLSFPVRAGEKNYSTV